MLQEIATMIMYVRSPVQVVEGQYSSALGQVVIKINNNQAAIISCDLL